MNIEVLNAAVDADAEAKEKRDRERLEYNESLALAILLDRFSDYGVVNKNSRINVAAIKARIREERNDVPIGDAELEQLVKKEIQAEVDKQARELRLFLDWAKATINGKRNIREAFEYGDYGKAIEMMFEKYAEDHPDFLQKTRRYDREESA